MTDYAKLRQLAREATPGPWEAQQDFIDMGVPDNSKTLVAGEPDAPSRERRTIGSIYLHSWADGYNENRNAEFIAAANPTAVLALLDELELERQKRAKSSQEHTAEVLRWDDLATRLREKGAALTKEVQDLYRECVRQMDEIDKLKVENAALRRGQGRAHDAPPTTGRLHETHPIPDSRSDT